MLASRVLRFDAFTLDLSRAILLKGDEQLALRRQSFEVLRHLAEHAGEVVSAEGLIEAVWPVRPAQPEHSVVQCIRDIRRALGEEARWIIRTVSGRGYQFMAALIPVEEGRSAPAKEAARAPEIGVAPASERRSDPSSGRIPTSLYRWQHVLIVASLVIAVIGTGGWLIWQRIRAERPPVLTMMSMPTLAVLPFTAPAAEPALGSEARALSDEVVSEALRHSLAFNIAFKSTEGDRSGGTDVKAIGGHLGARYLLVGSLRREGEERVANVRLIEAETGRELLARLFRYAPQDPLSGRGLAAVRIAGDVNMLVVTTEGRRPLPAVVEAGHYTITAVAAAGQLDARDSQEHLALYEKALALDPNWVPALLGYCEMQTELSRREPPDRRARRLDKAQAASERAIQLAPREAMGYLFRGVVLRARGDPVGAIAADQLALTLSPNLANAHGDLGLSKLQAGRAHETRAHIEEALRLFPGHRWQALWSFWAGQAAVHTGDYEAAVAWLQKAAHGKMTRQWLKPWLAVAYAGLGREEEGRDLIAQYAIEGHHLTISGWRKNNPRGGGVLAEQRDRIEGLLLRLGVPEGEVATSGR
jgi:DNA-binding winged helix-turn-helix (wHTH) protein/TolB-like protein